MFNAIATLFNAIATLFNAIAIPGRERSSEPAQMAWLVLDSHLQPIVRSTYKPRLKRGLLPSIFYRDDCVQDH